MPHVRGLSASAVPKLAGGFCNCSRDRTVFEGLISTDLPIYMGSNSMHTNTDDVPRFQETWLTSHG